MTWRDRLRPAAYTAPDGTRIGFQYTDLEATTRKKTIAHEFPDVDATYVEDLGLKGTQYPLRVYFSGPNHDLDARQFVSALRQRGPGKLDHPMYGPKTVIPFGDITRRDALVTGANESIFDVVFWETIAALYPASDPATLALVDQAVADYDTNGAGQFAAALEVGDIGERSQFAASMRQLKDGARTILRGAQDGTAALQNRMNRIDRAISSTLETFVGGPLTLAFQLRQLVRAPARSAALLRARLDAYANLATSIVSGRGAGSGGGTGTSTAGVVGVVDAGSVEATNRFQANRILADTAVLAFAEAVSAEEYRTRREALTSALELADTLESVVAWCDSNYAELFTSYSGPDITSPHASGAGAADSGEARQALITAVTSTLQYLIATSYTLGSEIAVELATPRTAVDLVAEFHGDLGRLEAFIVANDLTGSEILEIPRGRTVRYYA